MNNQQEFNRILNLSDFDLDYETLEGKFIHLNKLAAKIAGTEISQLNLIDNYTQWSISQIGTTDLQTPREETICTYTVEGNSPLEIPDLGKDDRFKNLESVKASGAKYYFGIPLISREGFSIGSLCVISLKDLRLSKEKKKLLKIIANEIIERLEELRQLRKARKHNSELISIHREVSHDLRGMINGIIGLADLINMEYEGSNNEIKKYLKLIKGSSKSMLEYVEDILEGNIETEDGLITIKKISEEIEKLYLPLAIKKDVGFKIKVNEKSSEQKFSDNMILQIVGNLTSNAIKFTPRKGKVHIDLKIVEQEKNELLEILVTDTGVGIQTEKINEILSRKAVSEVGTKGEKGYGLGLNLVQHHIEKLNGEFKIDSNAGKGSTFKVIIPINK